MQMIDMGIALCHFELSAKGNGLLVEFLQDDSKYISSYDAEYIASYQIIETKGLSMRKTAGLVK